jgi:hypothetical protein
MDKDYKIELWHDSHCGNPFEEDEGLPCIILDQTSYGCVDIRDHVFSIFNKDDALVFTNVKELCKILSLDVNFFKEEGYTKEELISELKDEISNLKDLDEVAAWHKLCTLLNIPSKIHESKGYSQGDYRKILISLPEKFFEVTGCNKENSETIIENACELFNNWMWGDTYGFTIYKKVKYVKIPKEDYDSGQITNVETLVEWEEVESCGGFYGTDWKNNGILDNINNDYDLEDTVINYPSEDIMYYS